MSIGTPAGQLIIENATVLTNNINVQDKIGVATNPFNPIWPTPPTP
jgi:hypothetical protein